MKDIKIETWPEMTMVKNGCDLEYFSHIPEFDRMAKAIVYCINGHLAKRTIATDSTAKSSFETLINRERQSM